MGEDEMNEEFFQSAPTGTGLLPAASLGSWVDITSPQPINHRPITAKPPPTQGFIGSAGHRGTFLSFSQLSKTFCPNI